MLSIGDHVFNVTKGHDMNDKPTSYEIIDRLTGAVIATRKSRNAATALADRKDLAFGSIRYIVKPVWENLA